MSERPAVPRAGDPPPAGTPRQPSGRTGRDGDTGRAARAGTSAGPGPGAPAGAVEVLRRWEASGAVWRVLARGRDGITVALLTCDAGEEMQRLTSDDPGLTEYLQGRDRSDEPPTRVPASGGPAT